MSTLEDLLAQRAALEKQIEEAKRAARSGAVAKVKALMAELGVSAADLRTRSAAKPAKSGSGKVAAKYRNGATGEAWSGRGLKPNWLKAALASGKKLEDFAV